MVCPDRVRRPFPVTDHSYRVALRCTRRNDLDRLRDSDKPQSNGANRLFCGDLVVSSSHSPELQITLTKQKLAATASDSHRRVDPLIEARCLPKLAASGNR